MTELEKFEYAILYRQVDKRDKTLDDSIVPKSELV